MAHVEGIECPLNNVAESSKDPENCLRASRPSQPFSDLKTEVDETDYNTISKTWYVTLCAMVVRLGGFLFGYDQGVISVILTMDRFIACFPLVSEDASGAGLWKGLLTAMIELGALIGAFNQGWISDWLSRKYSIVVAVVIFIIGSSLQAAARSYATLIVGRFIGGIAIGMKSMVVPMYISEVSPSEIRGTLLVFEEVSIVFGIIVSFWLTFGTRYIESEWSFRLPFMLQIFPALLLGVIILFLPFSPRWLAIKGRDQEALTALSVLRRLPKEHPRVRSEWLTIRAEVKCQRDFLMKYHPKLTDVNRPTRFRSIRLELAKYGDCFRSLYRKRTMIGVMLMFFQQFLGINALVYYSPSMFRTMGMKNELQLILSGVLNCTQFIGVLTSIFTMDRVGRRPLLLFGSALTTVCQVIISIFVSLFNETWSSHMPEAWASVGFLFLFMLVFGMTWGPVAWAMPSEIFPSMLRSKGVAWSTCSNWTNNFIIGLITPVLIQNTRGFGAYVFFAIWCGISFVWTYLYVPETKGKSLEDIDKHFDGNAGYGSSTRKTHYIQEFIEDEKTTRTI